MIRINLLPHREEARKAKRQQFYAMAGAAVALGALVVFLGYTIINGMISNQADTNDFLKREIAVLDKQIAEIKLLKEKTQALLARPVDDRGARGKDRRRELRGLAVALRGDSPERSRAAAPRSWVMMSLS